MISVAEAEQIVLKTAKLLESETVPLAQAYGRVLREKLVCDRDQPAFNKSTMDGIAISFDTFKNGTTQFELEGTIPAGRWAKPLKNKNGCFKIMTGAVVPDGCNCVIPIEYVHIQEKTAVVFGIEKLERGWNIRFQGQDCKKGKLLLKSGCSLSPVHIATAASFGKARIKVSVKPKVAIIATGDELVDIHIKNIKPFQIRKSNSYALDAALQSTRLCDTQMFHLKDDKKSLLVEIKKILSRFDILVLSGGVSMGDFDYVPQVLKELNVKVLFHKVAQKPGKPFWFGKYKDQNVVFALPGNPASTQMCAYRYVIPYLKKAAGLAGCISYVALAHDFNSKTDYTNFVPVKINFSKDAKLVGVPVSTGGSGDFGSLANSDGFIELKAGQRQFSKDSVVPFFVW
jgi:molybdopterin molybdotransferase